MEMASAPRQETVSVVITTHNEGEHLRRTIDNLLAMLPTGGEIVVVDDASTDGSTGFLIDGEGAVSLARPPQRLGVAAARNHGAALARGEVLAFSDAHVETPPGWVEKLCATLRSPEIGIVGPAITQLGNSAARGYGMTWSGPSLQVQWLPQQATTPYPVPLLGGGFLAMRREVFDDIGGFDAGMTIWGTEDAEICLRTWLLGYQCLVVPEVQIAHLFRPTFPYQVDWESVLHNALRLGSVHLGRERFARLVAALAGHPAFPAALTRLLDGDCWERRRALELRRRYDDGWFFHRFGIE